MVQELQDLSQRNITMNIESKDFKFKPLITHCGVDLPAKSMLQETKQYGSYDGCTYCEIPGELVLLKDTKNAKTKGKKIDTVKKKSNNKANDKKPNNESNEDLNKENKFVRYIEGDGSYKLRDEMETLRKMLAASSSTNNKAIDGIKGMIIACIIYIFLLLI